MIPMAEYLPQTQRIIERSVRELAVFLKSNNLFKAPTCKALDEEIGLSITEIKESIDRQDFNIAKSRLYKLMDLVVVKEIVC